MSGLTLSTVIKNGLLEIIMQTDEGEGGSQKHLFLAQHSTTNACAVHYHHAHCTVVVKNVYVA